MFSPPLTQESGAISLHQETSVTSSSQGNNEPVPPQFEISISLSSPEQCAVQQDTESVSPYNYVTEQPPHDQPPPPYGSASSRSDNNFLLPPPYSNSQLSAVSQLVNQEYSIRQHVSYTVAIYPYRPIMQLS